MCLSVTSNRETEDFVVMLGLIAGSPACGSVRGGTVFGHIFTIFALRQKRRE